MWKIHRGLPLLVILLVVGIVEVWFMDIRFANFAHRIPRETLVDAYTQALSQGESSLLGQTDVGPHRIVDASYFNGRIYVYYGIGPFVLVTLPWLIATGTYLSPAVCIFAALMAGYAAYGVALLLFFRQDQRGIVSVLLSAGFLAIVVSSGTWVLMDLPNIHQLESAFGYACTGLGVAFLTAAATGKRYPSFYFFWAALFIGLIMACRPNCLPAVLVLAATAGFMCWRSATTGRRWSRTALLVGLPLGLVAVALASWNYVRFGSVLEFGMRYGTGAEGNPAIVGFSCHNLAYNLHRYLLGGVRWGNFFPFIDGAKEGPFLRPYLTHESSAYVYGSFLFYPVLAFAFLGLAKRKGVGVTLLAAAGGNLFLLSGLGFGTYRYATDYLGPLSFVAAVGIGSIGVISNRHWQRFAACMLVALLGYSTAAAICQTVSIARTTALFDERRPDDFAALARPFNRAAYMLEKVTGNGPRSFQAKLHLPNHRFGKVEPLLVYGDAGVQDFFYFYYAGLDKIQVGFESMGHGGPLSFPVQIDYRVPHTIDIFLGSELPPNDHPLLRALPVQALDIARKFMRVAIDGQVVLEGLVDLHPVRSRIFWGESPDDAAFGKTFTGTFDGVARPLLQTNEIYPHWSRDLFGPVVMKLGPSPQNIGASLPLVSIGNRPSGGALVLDCLSPTRARLRWVRLNGSAETSEAFAWNYQQTHEIEFFEGSLLPPVLSELWPANLSPDEKMARKRTMTCRVDGHEVWRTPASSSVVAPSSVKIGENVFQLPDVRASLDTTLISAERKPW